MIWLLLERNAHLVLKLRDGAFGFGNRAIRLNRGPLGKGQQDVIVE